MDINKEFFAAMCGITEDRLEWCIIEETDYLKSREDSTSYLGLIVKGTNLIFNIEKGELCQEEKEGSFCRTFMRAEKIEDKKYPNYLTLKAFQEDGESYIQKGVPMGRIVDLYKKRWVPLSFY